MRWRYIGQVEPPADIKINAKDFWEENPAKRFFLDEREALLWGKCKNESMGNPKKKGNNGITRGLQRQDCFIRLTEARERSKYVTKP